MNKGVFSKLKLYNTEPRMDLGKAETNTMCICVEVLLLWKMEQISFSMFTYCGRLFDLQPRREALHSIIPLIIYHAFRNVEV